MSIDIRNSAWILLIQKLNISLESSLNDQYFYTKTNTLRKSVDKL